MIDEKRHLLLMAAKAAGIPVPKLNTPCAGIDERGIYTDSAADGRRPEYWNPLNDDAQLMQLARELKISIDYHDCYAWHRFANGDLIQEFWGGECGTEAEAIMRAAALIGEGCKMSNRSDIDSTYDQGGTFFFF